MSKYTEEELNQALEDTGRLLQDVPLTREYDLDDILAEFGTGAVKPQQPRPEPPQPVRSRAAVSRQMSNRESDFFVLRLNVFMLSSCKLCLFF